MTPDLVPASQISSFGPSDGPRHQARERALSLLYEADLKSVEVREVVSSLPAVPDSFALALVLGVQDNLGEIDKLVSTAAVGWEMSRMPVIDRAALRLATWELMFQSDTSIAVVIDEAVELVKQYSTEQSGAFVNGVLSTIAQQVRS